MLLKIISHFSFLVVQFLGTIIVNSGIPIEKLLAMNEEQQKLFIENGLQVKSLVNSGIPMQELLSMDLNQQKLSIKNAAETLVLEIDMVDVENNYFDLDLIGLNVENNYIIDFFKNTDITGSIFDII